MRYTRANENPYQEVPAVELLIPSIQEVSYGKMLWR